MHPRLVSLTRNGLRAAFAPSPKQSMWEWADENVVVPLTVGSTNPGQLDTGLNPVMRGLSDLMNRPKTRFFTLCKSARTGGTLLSILKGLYKMSTKPGPILWMDPSRKTAARFSRSELQPFMKECPPVAKQIRDNKTDWTTLEMRLRTCEVGVVGSGSAADLAGRQAELVVINEKDKIPTDLSAEAGPADLAIVRSKQFWRTRLILQNSTPTLEYKDTWQDFLKGSQHYCYIPCPHCKVKQRLTFSPEEKSVPFDMDGNPLPAGETRLEKTGKFFFEHCRTGEGEHAGWDYDKVERDTKYQCAHCHGLIEHTDLMWMLDYKSGRQEWRSHNPAAPEDVVSAHIWAAYSPFEQWGFIAKKFLLSKSSASKLHDFYNSDLGLPFRRNASSITESDLDHIIKASPDYQLGQLPFKPEYLTMKVDVQSDCMWWVIRAFGICRDLPGKPIVTALIDYGQEFSWQDIKDRSLAEYIWPATGDAFEVYVGLVDSGFEAQKGKAVYEFCLHNANTFNPSKGSDRSKLRGKSVTQWTQELKTGGKVAVVAYDDEHFKQNLYYDCIKTRRSLWWLPRDIGLDYRAQLTAERTEEVKLLNGTMGLKWIVVGPQGNHLADCEKGIEVLREIGENDLDLLREEAA